MLGPTNKRAGSNIIWKCRCDCGKICYVNTVNLKNSTKSCGCLKQQKLENRIGNKNPNYKYGRKEAQRRSKLKSLYKITFEEYKMLNIKQQGVCIICQNPKEKRKLCVDHNHKTDKIRGLLCHNCNLILGLCKENTKILKNCIKYLNKHKE